MAVTVFDEQLINEGFATPVFQAVPKCYHEIANGLLAQADHPYSSKRWVMHDFFQYWTCHALFKVVIVDGVELAYILHQGFDVSLVGKSEKGMGVHCSFFLLYQGIRQGCPYHGLPVTHIFRKHPTERCGVGMAKASFDTPIHEHDGHNVYDFPTSSQARFPHIVD